jgi:predicted Zn-dependent protease
MSDHDHHDDEVEYTDDPAEALGYTDHDWDTLDEADVEQHDAILSMSLDELDSLDVETMTDLQRWAAAQALSDHDEEARFLELALRLVHKPEHHPALDYGEIGVEILNDYLLVEQFDDARALLKVVTPLVTDDPHFATRFGAIIDIVSGNVDDGLETFQHIIDNAGDDAMLLLAVAEDLISVEAFDAARALLSEVEILGNRDKDSDVLAGVTEARAFLEQVLEEVDED